MNGISVGVVAMVLVVLSAHTCAYTFSEVDKKGSAVERADLTTNEEERIYGGFAVNIDKYPFLASLRDTRWNTTVCSGTLIAPQYILTAASCVKTGEFAMDADFGTNASDDFDLGSVVKIPIVQGFRHPLYNNLTHRYNVGLLKLKEPVERETVKLCAADGSDNKVGTMATVPGWGETEDVPSMMSPVLKEVTVPIISNAECGKYDQYIGRITEDMLCAGTGNGKDHCTGDGGGPLLVNDDIQVAVVSWGIGCGKRAGVYTRMTLVMDYINDVMAGGDGSRFNVTSFPSSSSMGQAQVLFS